MVKSKLVMFACANDLGKGFIPEFAGQTQKYYTHTDLGQLKTNSLKSLEIRVARLAFRTLRNASELGGTCYHFSSASLILHTINRESVALAKEKLTGGGRCFLDTSTAARVSVIFQRFNTFDLFTKQENIYTIQICGIEQFVDYSESLLQF